MLEIMSARNTQSMISEVNYRKHLHQWICLPDMQVFVQARKVNEQLSDVSVSPVAGLHLTGRSKSLAFPVKLHTRDETSVHIAVVVCLFAVTLPLADHSVSPQIFYKDDMNWLRGIGCYAWDTPEIIRCKQSNILQSEVRASPRPPPHLCAHPRLALPPSPLVLLRVIASTLPKSNESDSSKSVW